MKPFAIFLIVTGIAMFIIRSFSYTQEKNVVDIGPLEVNKKETKTISWPLYAGGVAVLAGVGILIMSGKKSI